VTGADAGFRLGYVPGVTISRWQRTWAERSPEVRLTLVPTTPADAAGLIRAGEVDAALLRLPVDRTGLHAIPLYTETTVVLAPKDHWLAAADETVALADLAGETLLRPVDDVLDQPANPDGADRPGSVTHAIGMVAAEAGLLLVPLSLARLHARKDLIHRAVDDAPQSRVALSWPSDVDTSELVERFIGIVRGRTPNSTRGPVADPRPDPARADTPRAGKPKPGSAARTPQRATRRATPAKRKPRRR
jgi:DNA-binding transcriptional LysR family regulator